MEKNQKIQMIRGLAIFAVVLIHTCPAGMWQVIIRPFINFCVATFIFLSGYLTKIENDNWYVFFKKRIAKVLIPYIIWNVLYTLYNYAISGWGGIRRIIVNLITTKSAAQLYFVFVYIQFVLLTPLLGKLLKTKYHWIGWFITPVSTVIFKYYYLLSGNEMNKYVSMIWGVCCLSWFTFYYLGLMLGNKIKICKYDSKKLLVFYGLSIILQMGEGYIFLLLGDANCGTQAKLTAFLTSAIFILLVYEFLNNNIDIKCKFLTVLGDCSFGIYLSHIMIMKVLSFIPYYTSIPYIVNSLIVLVLSLVFVLSGRKLLGNRLSKWLGLL